AMIILNQPITRKDVFVRAWRASEVHLCADGGANRLYDIWNADQRASYTPTMIKGDLDSIRSDVKAYYSASGVPVKYDGDQYATDLMKCIREVEAIEKATGRQLSLLLMGGLSGRIDQTVHTMSLLHKLRKSRPSSFVLSGESLAWVLDEGSHLIEIDHSTMGETCGILPVGIDKAMVHTEGLKWNLSELRYWTTSFDGQISTSNHLVPSEPVVSITTDRPILWCIEVRPNLGQSSPTNRVRTRSSYGPEELKRDIRGLSMGVARTAEDVGKDLLRVGRG
ncbi:Thiamin pyrophosphokinase, partial [Naematelia encephala]